MAYDYKTERPKLFTEEGQRVFLAVRDRVNKLLNEAGAFRMDAAWGNISIGDSWFGLALVDRLVELREIREITGTGVAGQNRVFVRAN